jgi:hypothetical protein
MMLPLPHRWPKSFAASLLGRSRFDAAAPGIIALLVQWKVRRSHPLFPGRCSLAVRVAWQKLGGGHEIRVREHVRRDDRLAAATDPGAPLLSLGPDPRSFDSDAGLRLFTSLRCPLKDDIAWLLYVAREWLSGRQLYVDLIEVNPPMIVWILSLPAALSGALGVAAKLVAVPFFAACVLGSAGWCAKLVRGYGPLGTVPLPLFTVVGTVLLALPGPEFGQREHLLVAAALPYLHFRTQPRQSGNAARR